MKSLIDKYNIAAPRYTSYPTVPYWDNNLNEEKWINHIQKAFIKYNADGISLYIHLPYCESLCTYCACNTRITVNHKVELPYIESVLKEWQLYLNQFQGKPLIKEIHLGGGTPTFFSPENLTYLLSTILNSVEISKEYDFSFEGHPGNTTKEHLQALYDLGFKRVSFGIQDFDEKVQDTINRYQTFEEVKQVLDDARKIGYTSINFDLVYGLPYQTVESINDTITKIISLKPERIAFYSYAHVPWLKPGQRKYSEKDLPADSYKRSLYETGKELFLSANYDDIGMDHFALPDDALFDASKKGTLHRNFMGYTTNTTKLLVALGCSSISDSWDAFAQNIKTVEEYQKVVNEGHFPIFKGHVLTEEDLIIRQHILNMMCKNETSWFDDAQKFSSLPEALEQLKDLEKDGLATVINEKLIVTETGKAFLRNICLCFDTRYWAKKPEAAIFSSSV
ncbi:MAG: oxygen-independent coproporphyrinogen III oxidase [Bacteroidetes bacterium]|nr:oxygen-independent coproporphyrinogen III oxidase [Bacteroidota bacterium]